MGNRLKRILREFNSVERGHLLIVTLLFVFLSALIIPPTLGHIHTTLKTERIYDEKTYAVYAADSGIENAVWHVREGDLATLLTDPTTYDPYDFETSWQYPLDEQINGDDVTVSVENIWIPEGLPDDNPAYILGPDDTDIAGQYAETDRLMVTGRVFTVPVNPEEDPYTYEIKLTYKPVVGDALSVESIGAWLPDGFDYVEGSSSLEAEVVPVPPYQQNLEPPVAPYEPCNGGKAIIWNWDPALLYMALPGTVAAADTITAKITFDYTSSKQGKPPIVSWVKVTGTGVAPVGEDLTGQVPPYTWDADVRIFHLTSQAGEATVEARTAKNELRKMPAAIEGDYLAAGNSLMRDTIVDANGVRDVLDAQSSATVDSIPDDAQVELAYLYWSGWFENEGAVWTDACADFSNWSRYGAGSQTRVPTADGDTSGTWNTSPCWDDVDETTYNDADYMTGTTDSGGYKLFSFSSFSIPAGSPISDLTVYVRAKDSSFGSNNIRPSIKVNGTRYNTTATINYPGTSFAPYSYAFTTNPNTGLAWTAEDINGTGTHPLQQFGVYSSDLNPDIRVSMVYAQVNCETWTISSDRFQGHYGGGGDTYRQLDKSVSLDLTPCIGGAVYVTWDQSKSGYLESTDGLDFQFSADGGSTWGSLIQAFRDDTSTPTSPFTYLIPAAYLTADFKMRFYLQGFGDSGEYCYVDNIEVTKLMPDPSVIFKINGEQVYLDGDGLPLQGVQPLAADSSQTIINYDYGTPHGFSYASKGDVTALLRAYSDVGDGENHTGNGIYTVGSVSGDVGDNWSYAGWSLVIIYSSSETNGHQLYLYDTLAYCDHDTNIDFDYDGQPGGTIGGFIVPEQIEGEVNAAKLTCFVGEGDNCWTDDYLAFNGTKLWDGTDTYAQSIDNVWDSKSLGMSAAGVDVDTFEVAWDDGLLEPGATSAQIDIVTGIDIWNLIYVILSFRSETSTGGAITYLLEL